ncbi:hypothetical protein N8H71_01645 [Pseudomonas koreensis]|uniref:hypothetical protein n=1 Tax=Pseudomonas koreensis TaxID=198620 RepID=UPI0021C7A8AB|nr:hypothetical protein [Pseudomonas koreensis]MCU0070271.1 hypothetical protein [Pseudomonas koreensis]
MNNPASNGGPVLVLALTPPYIPRQTYPINHPVAQVGLSRLNYYADSKGLLVLFGPYQGQAPNETGRMFLNGLPAPIPAELTKDTTSPLEFHLPVGTLSDDINTLKVSVQRQSGNEESAELIVLHYLTDPAGNDTDQNPGNSLLSMDVTPKSIGPGEAAAGVTVTMDYPGKQLHDRLTINYGGKTLTHQLSPTGQDPNPETRPVVLTFYTADLAHSPNNPQFVFKYNVINQVGDFSGTSSTGVFNPQEFWSKDYVVDVHLDWVELPEAILQETLGDNGDDPALVDLGKMNGGPLWALIHLIPSIWQAGDQIHLTFEAWLNGAVVASHDEAFPIGNVPGQFSWQIPNAKVVANSQVRVKFEQIRGGKVIGISKTAEAQVVGTGLPELEMDTTPVSLSGARYYVTPKVTPDHGDYGAPSNPNPGTSIDRPATGGVGIISYHSTDAEIVAVDSKGRIYARGNGMATITAKDAANQTKSYTVTTSGPATAVHWSSAPHRKWAEILPYLNAVGGRLFTLSEIQSNYRSFVPARFQIVGQSAATLTSTPGQTGTHWGFTFINTSREYEDSFYTWRFLYVKV